MGCRMGVSLGVLDYMEHQAHMTQQAQHTQQTRQAQQTHVAQLAHKSQQQHEVHQAQQAYKAQQTHQRHATLTTTDITNTTGAVLYTKMNVQTTMYWTYLKLRVH
jgi:hypothetical protein